MDGMPSVLPVSQAEAAREAARRQAIFSGGHKFISLTLVNTRYRSICGIEMVNATPYVDEMAGGITRYHLEIRGGNTDFQYDPSRGVFRYAMLDSDHNRRFLASHYHLELWQIEDEDIDEEIAQMSERIEAELKGEKQPQKQSADDPDTQPQTEQAPEEQQRGRMRGRPARRSRFNAGETATPPPSMGIQSDLVSVNQTRVVAP